MWGLILVWFNYVMYNLSHCFTIKVVKRGFDDKLIIDGTSYNDQGEYVCEAVNMIDKRRKEVQSGPIRMEVRGKLHV